MELRQLRNFVAVAEEGNISRAAQRIFLTQPALSRQIKSLEEEIGQCLLERSAHSIRLTPAGEALLEEARELLRHADAVLERVRTAAAGLRLRVGYAPSLASGLLSTAVQRFTQLHPDAHVELADLSSSELLSGVEAGKLDVILTVANDQTRGLDWIRLTEVAWRVAVASDHPSATRPAWTPREISEEPLLVYGRREYPEYWQRLIDWMRAHGARPRVRGEYDGIESLMSAVASGLGVALVIDPAHRRSVDGTRLKRITEPPPPVVIAAAYRTDRAQDPRLGAFLEELKRSAAELGIGAGSHTKPTKIVGKNLRL